jgi:serine/threonine protein kinase
VALKFLPTVVQTPRLLVLLEELVRREIAGCTVLHHERLVRTYDLLTVHDPATPRLDGSVALVMELAQGPLRSRLALHRGSPLPGAERALREIAEGLAWMHGRPAGCTAR